ncbi:MAG: MYG1 family protein [Opitutales bacterium]
MPFAHALTRIVTHPGGAHKDELLACAVCLANQAVPIERREPTDADLEDPAVAVIDIGDRHEPEKSNFDHHQFPREHPPTCSLSLVLQQLGVYADARAFCAWLEPAEWFDSRGAKATAEHLGIPREAVNQLNSPIDVTLLRRFAAKSRIDPGEPIHAVLSMIGEDLLDYIDGLRAKLAFLAEHATVIDIESEAGVHPVLFLPRTDPLPPEPSVGIGLYLERAGLSEQVVGLIYPDRRGPGYGLSRHQDHPALDFTRVANEPDVHFAHKQGFVAKTTATDPERLQALVAAALAATPHED